jgi:predicted nucleic-acid-binding protein
MATLSEDYKRQENARQVVTWYNRLKKVPVEYTSMFQSLSKIRDSYKKNSEEYKEIQEMIDDAKLEIQSMINKF